ncbi:hypothetical protein GW915_00850 [bacterium]|nr:hypothetical protein [bacterium]
MHYTQYRIFLQNDLGEREVLDYELYDTPITYKWMTATLFALEQGLPVWGQSTGIFPSQKYLNSLYRQLLGLIEEVNGYGQLKIPSPVLQKEANLSQAWLNTLHQHFHEYEEGVLDSGIYDDSRLIMQELNILIHRIEQALGNLDGDSRFYYQNLVFYYKGQRRVDLELSDYEEFVGERYFGDLLLGYGTTGKSLYQCYENNDLELVRAGLVRPQKDVSTEVLAYFPSFDPEPGDFEKEQGKMQKWFFEKGLDQYEVDITDVKHLNFKQPQLGVIIGDYSNDDITDLLTRFPNVLKTELY